MWHTECENQPTDSVLKRLRTSTRQDFECGERAFLATTDRTQVRTRHHLITLKWVHVTWSSRSYLALEHQLSASSYYLNIPSFSEKYILVSLAAQQAEDCPIPTNASSAIQFLADMGLLVYSKPTVTLEPKWLSEALGRFPHGHSPSQAPADLPAQAKLQYLWKQKLPERFLQPGHQITSKI